MGKMKNKAIEELKPLVSDDVFNADKCLTDKDSAQLRSTISIIDLETDELDRKLDELLA